jgi:Tol biopolymer transport system component
VIGVLLCDLKFPFKEKKLMGGKHGESVIVGNNAGRCLEDRRKIKSISFCNYLYTAFGLIIFGIFLAGCGISQKINPTPTPTPTSPSLPTATATPLPTSTPTITPSPTPTLIGGFAGNFITVDDTGTNAKIVLWNSTGDLIKDLWEFPANTSYDEARWSPKGDKIIAQACSLDFPLQCDFFIISPDGDTVFQLPIKAFPGIDWSPDEKMLAYWAFSKNGSMDIFFINPDGSNIRQLTNTNSQDSDPLFSPDGSKLLWHNENSMYIYEMNTDTKKALGMKSAESAWAPDSSKVVFSGMVITIINSDGSNPVILSSKIKNWFFMDYRDPVFSPDGKWVLYHSYGYEKDGTGIESTFYWIAPADGSLPQQMIAKKVQSGDARWSPDSQYIIFHGIPANSDDLAAGNYAVHPDGSGLITLSEKETGMLTGLWQPQE